MQFTAWIEHTGLSVFIRESPSLLVFPAILTLHAFGMAFLAGINAAIDLRVLGFAARVPLKLLERYSPVLWFGFAINSISGLLLLIAYPTKALTNPVFYLKLACIAGGMIVMFMIRNRALRKDQEAKALAILSLILWAGAIFAGRLLAYTCTYLLADSTC